MLRTSRVGLLSALLVAISAAGAWAQNTGSITGRAEDSTGAVLPGVSVVASCECLIGGDREAVTGAEGRFNLVDLPPGVYSVRFTLPGFSAFVVEGLQLTSGFAATANASMAVGGLEETITVSGAAPLVDIQNVRTQSLVETEVLEALPTGLRDIGSLADMTLGAVAAANSVGGNLGEVVTGVNLHGSRGNDTHFTVQGLNTNSSHGSGGGTARLFKFNMVAMEETQMDTSGAMSDTATGGANINLVPREGSNIFSARTVLNYTNDSLTSGKIGQDLIDRGISRLAGGDPDPSLKSMSRIWDYGFGAGGPIARDTVWFYSAYRNWGSDVPPGGSNYYNKSTDWRFYEADLSRPAETENWVWDVGGRVTWQAAEKHRIGVSLNLQKGCTCFAGIGRGEQASPEASGSYRYTGQGDDWPMRLIQATWTYPVTNTLLFQAGSSNLWQTAGVSNPYPQLTTITEQRGPGGGAYRYNGLAGASDADVFLPSNNWNQYASLSYITGSHQLEVGMQTQFASFQWGPNAAAFSRTNALASGPDDPLNALNYEFRNGVPVGLTMYLTGLYTDSRSAEQAIYVQDQWTLDRVTLNLGLRYDHLHARAIAVDLEPGVFNPPGRQLSFPELNDLPNYHDISPRAGAAWDVFGDGRTAVKGSWGRYIGAISANTASNNAPSLNVISSTDRTWLDTDGDYYPDCDFMDPAGNGECGPWQSPGFGQNTPASLWDEDARKGWGVREANHRISVALQQELMDGVGVEVSYHRTWWVNHQAEVNTVNGPEDYRSYCMTAPNDPRLGSISGQEVCGIWEALPAAFGNQRTIQMLESDVPGAPDKTSSEIFNGVDFAVNARFANGALVRGGVSLGRTAWDHCWANDLPNVSPQAYSDTTPRIDGFCNYEGEKLWDAGGSQLKLQAAYPLPGGVNISAAYKDIPGVTTGYDYRLFNFETPNSTTVCEISGFVGDAAAACPVFKTVALIPEVADSGNGGSPAHDDRIRQLDLRFTKNLEVAGLLIRGFAEVYNIFNIRPAQSTSDTAGGGGVVSSTWPFPTSVLGGRTAKFGVSIDY